MRVNAHRARRIVAANALALGVFLAAIAPTGAAGAAQPATHTVVIDAVRFAPEVVTVKTGDTVIWINKDPFPHTVTSQDGRFDSREILPGKSWRYKAIKAGVFPYMCTLHPSMKATFRVE